MFFESRSRRSVKRAKRSSVKRSSVKRARRSVKRARRSVKSRDKRFNEKDFIKMPDNVKSVIFSPQMIYINYLMGGRWYATKGSYPKIIFNDKRKCIKVGTRSFVFKMEKAYNYAKANILC